MIDKQLANGQLGNAFGDLYTVSRNKRTILSIMTMVNTDVTARTVNIQIVTGSGSRLICPKDFSLGAGHLADLDEPIILETGDKIQGKADTAAKVDFVISGEEI